MTTSISHTTGAVISGDAYDDECIEDLLSTPLVTYPMRPEYGWIGFEILDQPLTRATGLLLTSAAAMAMRRWLPAIKIRKVTLTGDYARGTAALTVERVRRGPSNSLTAQTIPLSR
ncbi:oxidoreductase [Novosphingobium sp.]|uniref:oxidoreductase n=1 Tax=Novosphingobium sp. TaxID=1874826 RepID=UPI0031CEFC80